VGRTLALLLARERLRVGLVREAGPASGEGSDVRAYALNAASRELLEGLRGWPDAAHATPVRGMEVHGDQGGALRFDAAAHAAPALAWVVDVQALQQRLDEALRFQPLVEWLAAPQQAPLTIICEGRASQTPTVIDRTCGIASVTSRNPDGSVSAVTTEGSSPALYGLVALSPAIAWVYERAPKTE